MSSTRIAIAGGAGRMGQRLIALANTDIDLEMLAAWEAPGHADAGTGFLKNTMQEAIADAQVYIDFTRPEPTLAHLEIAAEAGVAAVIGTTGFETPVATLFAPYVDRIPVMWAPNMSAGVNLLRKLVEDATRALGRDFDAEILEIHHRWKEDAPSGTAKALLRAVQAGKSEKTRVVTGRDGMVGARSDEEIGAMALRGGDVVGDHTVYLLGQGERIELTHRAQSRDTFAHGALRAAKWIVGQKPGLYDMFDVLGWGTR